MENRKDRIAVIVTVLLLAFKVQSQTPRNLLSFYIAEDQVLTTSRKPILFKDTIRHYLKLLSPANKEKIIKEAEGSLNYNWPSIPLTSYLDFKQSGQRTYMESFYTKRNAILKAAVLGELLEGKGRFMPAIINGCWAICEESTWVLSAHLPSQKGGAGVPNINDPIIDLGAGEVSAMLAWTYNLFKDEFNEISPFINERILKELNERIIQPYIVRDDFWWMAFKNDKFVNNWNPWCNYNVLLTTFLLGRDIDEQLAGEVLNKSLRSVDKFINYYKEDGVCEEGPAYWSHAGGKLMEYLILLLKITDNKVSLQSNELIQNIASYIKSAHIAGDYFVNFADSSVRVHPNPGIIFRSGSYLNDASLKSFASLLAEDQKLYNNVTKGSLDQVLNNLSILKELHQTPPIKNNDLYKWFESTHLLTARTSADDHQGFFFAAKGGYNDESHNHNDAGSFILYHNGKPLIIDVGVGTYTKKTFSKQRYDIWTMQSDYHNLPLINSRSQPYGKNYSITDPKFANRRNSLSFTVDLSGAYPDSSGCTLWQRTYNLKRGKYPEFILNDVSFFKKTEGVTEEHFMLSMPPEIIKEGIIKLKEVNKSGVYMYFSKDDFEVSIETIKLRDDKLIDSWQQDKLYRLILKAKAISLKNDWTIKIIEKKD